MGPSELGTFFMVGGIVVLIYQTFIFPPIVNKFKPLIVFKVGILMVVPTMALMPFANDFLNFGRVWLWVYLVSGTLIRSVGLVSAYTCVFMLINNSEEPRRLGAVNGFAQSLVALFRSFGPAIGSLMLSWSLTNGKGFPVNYWFIFLFEGLVLLIIFSITFLVKAESINVLINQYSNLIFL
eukprot:TRINITY_DN4925_c0_g1_i2.p1 TRINITY_DN4925_c0_g1~~TRINITY_DN4925_c0_g1_i2.p1  ORF type:complete len:181 (+),score=23.25 TRINITY_DN4925_c0_g1_i2:403-945(+)